MRLELGERLIADGSGVRRYEECGAGFSGSGRTGAAEKVVKVCGRQGKLHRAVLYDQYLWIITKAVQGMIHT